MHPSVLYRPFLTLLFACSFAGTAACVDDLQADAGSQDAGWQDAGSQDAGSQDAGSQDAGVSTAKPNILLIIADDLGVESSVCYSDNPAPAPNLLAFCDEAVVFDNVWSSPICSPTRAGMLTGRHSFRTGIGEQLTPQNDLEIDANEWTLPRVLDAANSGYAHASFGKWHLGGDAQNPNAMGWGHFSGLLDGALSDYERWEKIENGISQNITTYATTEITNDTIDWIAAQSTPWLAWVAYTAPHTPFHLPPADLHTQQLVGTADDIMTNPEGYFHAAVEALDTEMARLLDSLPEDVRNNTTVIFIGDNGTTAQVSEKPAPRAKGSLYQGGIHVPLMIWGAGVQSGGRRDASLVNSLDLYATILNLAKVDLTTTVGDSMQLDARSLTFALAGDASTEPGSTYILAELFGTVSPASKQGETIRDAQYKLMQLSSGATRFYDLSVDPNEANVLNAANRNESQQSAFERLTQTLASWTSSPDSPRAD
ncbi:MAG: sulfatase-like hydrolase/transferase [Deltaproteobacteria bacterium]|nr:sulfatase-like hydrolase/transferase [Deltaproteobacteria bacterium]